jgi:AcrR family transcriptional regulator
MMRHELAGKTSVAERKDPKSRREEARQRMYHDLIFEAAEQIFAEKGYAAGTMQDVAAEAGISLKTLYATFPGKSELYDEIRQVRTNQLIEAIAAAHDTGDIALESLERGVHAYVEFLVAHENFLGILLRGGLAGGLSTGPSVVAEQGAQGVVNFADILSRGMDEGTFHRGDPAMMAHVGIAIMQVWLGRIPERGDKSGPELAEEILLQLRRILGCELAAA